MSTVRLTVQKVNKKTLATICKQVFTCERMDKVVDVTGGGAQFFHRAGDTPIPVLYKVEQTTAQIAAMCNLCCNSTSNG